MTSPKDPKLTQCLSRREFLRISTIGFTAVSGLFLPSQQFLLPLVNQYHFTEIKLSDQNSQRFTSKNLEGNQQGRVINEFADVFDFPSFSGNRLNRLWKDRVISITGITIGKSEDSSNLIWYKLGTEGYAHSSEIQLVMTKINPVNQNIPENGVLAEVTVPYTDARWDPGMREDVAYRFYYSTTYWVVECLTDDNGNFWYGVRDDKWDYVIYVLATHLRIIPYEELKPISTDVPINQKRIEVHLPEQVMIAYEYDLPVYMARVSTGAVFSNGDYTTPPGTYTTFHKRPSRHMARGNLAANSYDLPGVPWNSYITEEGIAFHGTYWHNSYGQPRSHGCINLTSKAAKWLYLWTSPVVPPYEEWVYKKTGTNVDIIE